MTTVPSCAVQRSNGHPTQLQWQSNAISKHPMTTITQLPSLIYDTLFRYLPYRALAQLTLTGHHFMAHTHRTWRTRFRRHFPSIDCSSQALHAALHAHHHLNVWFYMYRLRQCLNQRWRSEQVYNDNRTVLDQPDPMRILATSAVDSCYLLECHGRLSIRWGAQYQRLRVPRTIKLAREAVAWTDPARADTQAWLGSDYCWLQLKMMDGGRPACLIWPRYLPADTAPLLWRDVYGVAGWMIHTLPLAARTAQLTVYDLTEARHARFSGQQWAQLVRTQQPTAYFTPAFSVATVPFTETTVCARADIGHAADRQRMLLLLLDTHPDTQRLQVVRIRPPASSGSDPLATVEVHPFPLARRYRVLQVSAVGGRNQNSVTVRVAVVRGPSFAAAADHHHHLTAVHSILHLDLARGDLVDFGPYRASDSFVALPEADRLAVCASGSVQCRQLSTGTYYGVYVARDVRLERILSKGTHEVVAIYRTMADGEHSQRVALLDVMKPPAYLNFHPLLTIRDPDADFVVSPTQLICVTLDRRRIVWVDFAYGLLDEMMSLFMTFTTDISGATPLPLRSARSATLLGWYRTWCCIKSNNNNNNIDD